MATITGRLTRSEPVMQNLPGSLAHDLMWAFERRDFRPVMARLQAEGYIRPRPTPEDPR